MINAEKYFEEMEHLLLSPEDYTDKILGEHDDPSEREARLMVFVTNAKAKREGDKA